MTTFTHSRWVLAAMTLISGSAQAALSITATTDIELARPLDLVNIEFIIANSDAVARTGVTVSMTFPSGINQVFETEFDADCASTSCNPGETGTWTIGTLPAGGAAMVSIPAQIINGAADGTILTFSPTVSDDTTDSDSDSVSVEVDVATRYDLSLAENADPVMSGSALVYTLTYGYLEDAAAVTNTLLSFTLPAGATLVSASDGGTLNGSEVEWPLGFMQPGEGGVRQVTVLLGAAGAGTTVATTAEIASLSDPTLRNGSGAATAIATGKPLSLAIEAAVSTVRHLEIANLQYIVTNNDPFTRFGVTLVGYYPRAFQQVFETEFDGNCASTTCNANERIIWNLGDIPAGSSVVVDMPPQANSLSLSGTIDPFVAQVFDPTGASARQTQALRIQTDTIYDLSLTEHHDPVVADSNLQYQLHFALRDDAGSVNNSRLVFPIPDGASFVSASGGGVLSSGVVEWQLGPLSPGDDGIRSVVVATDSGLENGTLQAHADIQGITDTTQRLRSEAYAVVDSVAPLTLSTEANPDPAHTSDLTNIRFTVSNNDPFTRFGVEIHLRYPQGFNQAFETEFDGNCVGTTCNSGERAVWLVGDIPAGDTVTVDLPATVLSVQPAGELINLFASAADDQGATARDTTSIGVTANTPYELSLMTASSPVTAGGELTYRLNWGYRDDAGFVSDSVLRFPVPGGCSFVSASDGGVLSNGHVEWDLGFVQPGQGGVRLVTVATDNDLAAGVVIDAAADLYASADPDLDQRATSNTSIAASVPLSLYVESNHNPSRSGELANQQITVANNDAFTRFGVTLQGRFPQYVNQAFETEFDGNCIGTTCSAGELITWVLGDIPAGDARTVDLPHVIAPSTVDGVTVDYYLTAFDDQSAQTLAHDSIRVQDDTVYDLALAEHLDPVTAGSFVDYAVTYGYRQDAPAVSDSTLRFYVPAGTSFVSASAGGSFNGVMVEWPLGVVSPGDGDLRTVRVQVDSGLPGGAVLEATAGILTAASGLENARAEAHTTVVTAVPLSLDIAPNRNNAEANLPVEMLLTVTNNDPFPHFGVVLEARFPQGFDQLFETVFAGDCLGTTCTAGERVSWLLGDIGANSSQTVLLPPVVSPVAIDGTIKKVFAWAHDDLNIQTRDVHSLLLGCLDSVDADCDAISDPVDNCTALANFGQQDTDNDDIGNRCDPDIAPAVNDCIVNFSDLTALKMAFFATPASPNWNPDSDFNSDNTINFVDLDIMKTFFFDPPGPSAAGCN